MLVRLLYASRAGEKLGSAEIDAILTRSRGHNPQHGITGVLCYSGELFMQVLEGGRAQVNALYTEIVRDPRHRDVTLLDYEEVAERHFAGWTMGRVNLAKINPSLLLKYSELPSLDPYAMSGKVSLALLEELISTAAIIGRGEPDD
jgi:hypothetical protein